MKQFLREPLLHFLLIGAFLFFTSVQVSDSRQQATKEIVIDDDAVGRIIAQYQSQMGMLPTKEALNGMIDDKVREEIYYREALKLGLDKDDEIVKRRLSQKFEFLENDMSVPSAPGEDVLRKFYNDHPNLFRDSSTVTFTHIYFSSDKEGSDAAEKRAENAYKKLSASNITRSPWSGDLFPLQSDYANITMLDAVQAFGKSGFSDSLFTIPVHCWSHPVQSGYGWHLIYVENRKGTSVAPFETDKEDVLKAWQLDQRSKANAEKYAALKSQYTIVRNYSEGK